MATAPTAPTAYPTPPSTTDPTNFDARADAFFASLVGGQTELTALATNAYNNAGEAAASAATATAASTAATATNAAVGAQANFKGDWSSLSGAVNKPASVRHNGVYWMLLNNLANITTSQPGVSADWAVVGPMPLVPIAANTTAVPWTRYLITAACTLTLPTPAVGSPVGVIVLPGVTGVFVSGLVRGTTGTFDVDAPLSADFTYSGATYGWV